MIRRLIIIVVCVLICVANSYAQKKYALLVGISDYHALNKANEWNNIHGTNDVSLITQLLKKQGFNVSAITETKATRANILKQLKQLTHRVSKGSLFICISPVMASLLKIKMAMKKMAGMRALCPLMHLLLTKKEHTKARTTLRMMCLLGILTLCASNLGAKENSMSSLMLAMQEKHRAILMMRRSREVQNVASLQAAKSIEPKAVVVPILWYL